MKVRRLQEDDLKRLEVYGFTPSCCFQEYDRQEKKMRDCGSDAVALAGAMTKKDKPKLLCRFHAYYCISNDKKLKKDWYGDL